MSMRKWLCVVVALAAVAVVAAEEQGPKTRFGAGAHYWMAVKDIDTAGDVEKSGLSYLASIQYCPSRMLRLQGDLEVFPEGFAGQTEATYAPQAFLIVGSGVYAGLGIGIGYADGEFAEDPFYTVRGGFDLELLPSVRLDLNVNYQFVEWEEIKELDRHVSSDTVTVGAAVRLEF